MNEKRKFLLFGLAILLIVVGAEIFFLYQLAEAERADVLHYERDEAELVVANTIDTRVSLYRAGKRLDQAQAVADFDGERMWLTQGNYFLKAEQNDKTVFYPVPILGYGQGNERDDSFSVTIRPIPAADPPTLLKDSPAFVFVPGGSFLMGDRLNPREPHYVWTQGDRKAHV